MAADALRLPTLPRLPMRAKTQLGGVLLLAMGVLLWLLPSREERAVDRLQVEGVFLHVSAEVVRAAVATALQDDFVTLDLEAVRHAVEALPWVERARVERVWPADVRVRVWERTPVARWGDHQLLSSQAQVFTPAANELDKKLPVLMASPGHEREVMETYQALSAALAGSPFALTGLLQDPRGEWTGATVSDIALHLGRGDPLAKVETLRGPVMRALDQRLLEVSHVDMRYSNGFSVAWRSMSIETPMHVEGVQHE